MGGRPSVKALVLSFLAAVGGMVRALFDPNFWRPKR